MNFSIKKSGRNCYLILLFVFFLFVNRSFAAFPIKSADTLAKNEQSYLTNKIQIHPLYIDVREQIKLPKPFNVERENNSWVSFIFGLAGFLSFLAGFIMAANLDIAVLTVLMLLIPVGFGLTAVICGGRGKRNHWGNHRNWAWAGYCLGIFDLILPVLIFFTLFALAEL